jgi:parallel beta-helix repeat protein
MNQCASLGLAGKAAALLVFCLLAWFSPTTAEAGSTIHNVRVNGDIQAAIDGASNGDTIQLAAGQYDITTTIDPGGKQVTIIGTVDGNGDPTSVLDGGNPVGGTSGVRVLICQNGETSATVFENLVIQNGYTSGDGGGMYNRASSSPTLTNCTFTDNSATQGGGMCNFPNSSPALIDCTFTNNSAAFGGGMVNISSSSPALTNCTFTNNLATSNGGGMTNFSSSPTLTNCTFTSNSADDDGGGMANHYSSSPTLINCTFTNNSAYRGGGMYNHNSSSPTLTGCTFTSNSADYGGGMYNISSSSPTLTDCNFCGNTSTSGNKNIGGDAIDGSSSGNLLLLNCNTGDVNFDLAIDSGDLGYLLALWGASSVLKADINQDGVVNGADLAYILGYFGGTTDSTTTP